MNELFATLSIPHLYTLFGSRQPSNKSTRVCEIFEFEEILMGFTTFYNNYF